MSKSLRVVTSEDRMTIHYQISCNGQRLEASEMNQAVEYQMGQGQWPIQVELQMLNETEGAQLNFKVAASEQAFGALDTERVIQMQAADFSSSPEPGELIEFELPDGEMLEGQVLSVFADKIEVDFNHPYAGRDLEFQIEIQSILPAKDS